MKKIVLPNGLRLLLVPQTGSLASSVLILVEAGSEYEAKRINGVSHFLEHLTFKGTKLRPKAGMIAEELAALGARSNAFTSQEYTGYWAKAEAKKVHKIVEIVSDLYLNPIFDAAEIEKERGVIIQEINMYEDDLPARVQKNLAALVYGDQPAGWDIGGQKSVIRALKRDDFIAYRKARYIARGTVVIVSGKFNERAVVKQIKGYFGTLPRRSAPKKIKTKEAQKNPRLHLQFKESDQAHFAMAFRAFNLFDKRRYAIQVLADVLGGGMSSRLFKRVREELGAAYYIGADVDLALDHGVFGVSAGVDHTRIELVIRTVIEECKRIRDEEIPEKELQRSKDHMIGSIILGLETSDQMGSYYGGQEILTGKTLSPEVLMDRIKKVTAAEVRAVARDILKGKGANLAIVGPYKKQEAFKKLLTL